MGDRYQDQNGDRDEMWNEIEMGIVLEIGTKIDNDYFGASLLFIW